MFRPALGFTVALLAFAAPAHAEVKDFRDFVAVCDNMRDCVAFGLGADAIGAYLKIERGGAPDAAPKITIVADLPETSTFTLAFDDPVLNAALPKGPFNGPAKNENVTRIEVENPAAIAALLGALRKAKTLRVTRKDPPGGTASNIVESELSMSGAVAALLWIDEQQKRLGTTTALIRRGDKPASSVPAPSALPIVVAAKANTAPLTQELPGVIAARMPKLCGQDEDEATFDEAKRLNGKLILYSFTCPSISGAYNFAHTYLVAPEDAPEAAHTPQLIIPPELKPEQQDAILTNPEFDSDTATLNIFAKGRGIGDCGIASEWIWDGEAFRVVNYRSMGQCRGVTPEDWPVLYRATSR